MEEILLVMLAGFGASMVDGALGMGFGPTSSTILLAGGMSPVTVSTTVNIAKVATGLAAGASHWRFDNIDRRLVARLALPGCVGAVAGAALVTQIDADRLTPWLAVMLLLVGLRILARFVRLPRADASPDRGTDSASLPSRGVMSAGAVGGLTNGLIGAWGPIVTPYLLHQGVSPRLTVGSVNTAEIAVAAVSVGSLLGAVGGGDLDAGIVLAMLIGGVAAAPLAAWLVKRLPTRSMGIAIGGLLLITSVRTLVVG